MRTESFVLRCQAIVMTTNGMVVGMGKSEDDGKVCISAALSGANPTGTVLIQLF
jgi:hypothetical protein